MTQNKNIPLLSYISYSRNDEKILDSIYALIEEAKTNGMSSIDYNHPIPKRVFQWLEIEGYLILEGVGSPNRDKTQISW